MRPTASRLPRMWLLLFIACSVPTLAACKEKLPSKYTALGIPPDPERVGEIEKTDDGYVISYKVPWSGAGLTAMEEKIRAAGYVRKGNGSTYEGPDGAFTFGCSAEQKPPACILRTRKD